jgi:hypothetical protein
MYHLPFQATIIFVKKNKGGGKNPGPFQSVPYENELLIRVYLSSKNKGMVAKTPPETGELQ